MTDPASKYQPIDSLPMAPGRDWLTRSDIGPFVDTGVDVQFAEYGRIYLSVDTVRELAEAAGLFNGLVEADPVDDAEAHRQAYNEGLNHRGDLDLAIERLQLAADALARPAELAVPALDEPEREEEPLVPVTDGPDRSEEGDVSDGAGDTADEPDRQVSRARRNKRPSLVPAGASDGDTYRI